MADPAGTDGRDLDTRNGGSGFQCWSAWTDSGRDRDRRGCVKGDPVCSCGDRPAFQHQCLLPRGAAAVFYLPSSRCASPMRISSGAASLSRFPKNAKCENALTMLPIPIRDLLEGSRRRQQSADTAMALFHLNVKNISRRGTCTVLRLSPSRKRRWHDIGSDCDYRAYAKAGLHHCGGWAGRPYVGAAACPRRRRSHGDREAP